MGKGVGETVQDAELFPDLAIRFGDLWQPEILRDKLRFWWALKIDQAEQIISSSERRDELEKLLESFFEHNNSLFEDYQQFALEHPQLLAPTGFAEQLIQSGQGLIFEGAQGALLDVDFGFWPYVTKSRTTTRNAEEMLRGFFGKIRRVGILRGYFTRHGRGPFVTEDYALDLSEKHNETNLWQEHVRCGWFDLVAARYALAINEKIDEIFLTCLDKMCGLPVVKVCLSYEYFGDDFASLNHWFEWQRVDNGRVKIIAIKVIGNGRDKAFAEALNNCRPYEFAEFAGWQFEPEQISCFADLPVELKQYVEFLEKALARPIRVVSIGPTWQDKFERK